MKSLIKKSLIGGLVFSFTALTVFIVYAIVDSTWTTPSSLEVGAGSGLSSTSWNKLLSNFNNLNDKVNNIKTCPAGMTKVADYCIDNTPVVNAAGYDQKVAITRCLTTGKHLCSWLELKTARINNGSSLCPGGVGRYSSSDSAGWDVANTRRMYIALDCSNISYDYMGRSNLNTDSSGESSFCCLSL